MKKMILLIVNHLVYTCFCLFAFKFTAHGQKPRIKVDAEINWPGVSGFSVSNNGGHLIYGIENSLVIQSLNSETKKVISGVSYGRISQSNDKVFFQKSDSLGVISLNQNYRIDYIRGIDSYNLLKEGDNNDFLCYKLKIRPQETIVREVRSGKEKHLNSIVACWIAANREEFIIETLDTGRMSCTYKLAWFDFNKDSLVEIWKGPKISSLYLASDGSQTAFSAADGVDSEKLAIWIYKRGERNANKVLDDQSEGIINGSVIQGVVSLNTIDERIFFNVTSKQIYATSNNYVPVDVWSYKDAKLQSLQLNETSTGVKIVTYIACLNLSDHKVVRLDYENEMVNSPLYTDKSMSYMIVIKNGEGDIWSEWNWNQTARQSVYVVDLKTGTRRLIDNDLPFVIPYTYILSYKENYIYYYDAKTSNYFCYNLDNYQRRNLTASIHGSWTDIESVDRPNNKVSPYLSVHLVDDDDAITVYDQHDVYVLNGSSPLPTINLTSCARRKRDLEFRLAASQNVIKKNQDIVFTVFDKVTKRQGLFKIKYGSPPYKNPIKLESSDFSDIIKARDTGVYFVTRMTAESSPNIFLTLDFRSYMPITNVHPEKGFNWMTTELINWTTFDGSMSQGILYKPENFDPLKRYPLLVYYYERNSKRLHKFLPPSMSDGQLNIPLYVSNGYLVFVPDIHYKIGWPGKSSYNAVVSGVKYLSHRKYIDVKKMGLQGHSFGGFETNYIVTHSHLFAAAMSASGVTDFVSVYGSLSGDGTSLQFMYETGQSRIAGNLASKRNLYIENSPVLRADQVTTPLLLMANKGDGVVPYQQGLELFTALRRLNKKVWMLQYDGQDHNVSGRASEDFSLRMFQFFNYYLKGDFPPRWMTVGVPAKLKGVDSGLDYDRTGAQP